MEYLICSPEPDRRLSALAGLLREDGKRARLCRRAPKNRRKTRVIAVFPFRVEQAFLEAQLKTLAPGSICFGGAAPDAAAEWIDKRSLTWINVLEDKRFQKQNSRLSAEGALEIWLQHSKKALCESTCAILGYGNLARACAKLFRALGVRVIVSARRKEARRAARKHGCAALHLPPTKAELARLKECDAIFNTVCAPAILSGPILNALKPGARVFDLASGTQNADPQALSARPLFYASLPGLPAKSCPESAAKALFSALRNKQET